MIGTSTQRVPPSKTVHWILAATSLMLISSSGCALLIPATRPVPNEPTREASQAAVPDELEATEAPTAEKVTCKTLIPDVVRISKESEDDVKVLQVYRPKTIKDRQDSYAAGKLKVPKNKTQVTVLSCSGLAALSDDTTAKLGFSMAYDLNGDAYVAFKQIGDAE